MRTMNTEEFSENIRLFSSVKKKDAQEQEIGQFGFDKPANSILFKRMLIEFTCLNTSNKTKLFLNCLLMSTMFQLQNIGLREHTHTIQVYRTNKY